MFELIIPIFRRVVERLAIQVEEFCTQCCGVESECEYLFSLEDEEAQDHINKTGFQCPLGLM